MGGRLKRRSRPRVLILATTLALLGVAGCGSAPNSAANSRPAGVPAAGKSARIDQIISRGTLRVGVTTAFPWLFRNTGAGGDAYKGSSWTLAKAESQALGVKLEIVQVSNDTKIPLVQSGGVDITIAPLAETAARSQVVDFVTYSKDTSCIFGLKTDSKAAAVGDISLLNDSKIVFAAYVGTNQAAWIPRQFPKAQLRTVAGQGQEPVDELLSGRADFVVADSGQEPILKHSYSSLFSIPSDCTTSKLNAADLGHAIAKDDPVFKAFLEAVERKVDSQLQKEDVDVVHYAAQHPESVG